MSGVLALLAIGAVALGIASLLEKSKCPACKTTVEKKQTRCSNCGAVLRWGY